MQKGYYLVKFYNHTGKYILRWDGTKWVQFPGEQLPHDEIESSTSIDVGIEVDDYTKHNPKNKMHAWYFKLLDDLKLLQSWALIGNESEYDKQVDFISYRLNQARQKDKIQP